MVSGRGVKVSPKAVRRAESSVGGNWGPLGRARWRGSVIVSRRSVVIDCVGGLREEDPELVFVLRRGFSTSCERYHVGDRGLDGSSTGQLWDLVSWWVIGGGT